MILDKEEIIERATDMIVRGFGGSTLFCIPSTTYTLRELEDMFACKGTPRGNLVCLVFGEIKYSTYVKCSYLGLDLVIAEYNRLLDVPYKASVPCKTNVFCKVELLRYEDIKELTNRYELLPDYLKTEDMKQTLVTQLNREYKDRLLEIARKKEELESIKKDEVLKEEQRKSREDAQKYQAEHRENKFYLYMILGFGLLMLLGLGGHKLIKNYQHNKQWEINYKHNKELRHEEYMKSIAKPIKVSNMFGKVTQTKRKYKTLGEELTANL